jgi:uncharacterized surface protein with fasciclin (FAS1) repeats
MIRRPSSHSAKLRPLRRTGVVVLVSSLALVGASCGSDDDGASVDLAEVADVADSVADSLVDGAEVVDSTSTDLAETLRANGLESVAGIVDQVDLSSVLGDDYTFFAPNDEAFTTLSADETADLLTNPDRILDVLRNHALAEPMTSSELAEMDTVRTEAGNELAVTSDGDVVRIGDATVVSSDLEVGGGSVLVIDGLLLP